MLPETVQASPAVPLDYAALTQAMYKAMKQVEREEASGVGYWGEKHTMPSGTPTTAYGHGATGLFNTPGVEPDVYSAIPMPLRGLMDILRFTPSRYTNPLYDILTGVQASTGSEKTNLCDDAPTAGLTKLCTQTSVFGRWERATREFELNRLGQLQDRADPLDLRLVNNPFMEGFGKITPEAPGGQGNILASEIAKLKFELMVAFKRDHARQFYAGTPANNSAGSGYKEITGLDILINTGKVDALTNVACPAADSDVKNHNYGLIGSAPDIVNVVTAMAHWLKDNAVITGLDPVKWVIAMRPQLFYELTAIWPCSYLTYRCLAAAAATPGQIDLREAVRMRDEMRAGKYLLIDGEQWPVVTDHAIAEEHEADAAAINPGQHASDIYFVPLTVLGAIPVTYMEYFDQQNPEAAAALGDLRLSSYFWTTNGGAFLWWAKPPRNTCIQWQVKMEPRLVLRTPFIAGRITNVRYEPLQHDRDVFPSDPYFLDGGQTTRVNRGSYYTDWGVGTGNQH